MDKKREWAIESQSRQLLEMVRKEFGVGPNDVISLKKLCDPYKAADILNYQVMSQISLGNFGEGGQRFEVAGAIDTKDRKIFLSEKFGPQVVSFTLGHEIGHHVLGHNFPIMHRDKPVEGLREQLPYRSRMEQEADFFSSCLHVPRGLLKQEFVSRFGECPFKLDEHKAFMLAGNDTETLLNPINDLELPILLSSAREFEGRNFDPLYHIFGVSLTTMAIRIKKLNFIRY